MNRATLIMWSLRREYEDSTCWILSMSHLGIAGCCAKHQNMRIAELTLYIQQSHLRSACMLGSSVGSLPIEWIKLDALGLEVCLTWLVNLS